ncbi:hypothetical protein HPB49_010031 [Dermacentor silvarum]|uniref:Uncharacterized protein n=1 Tax=Dermacentor silvarum TaxID=543639 RepID=A0ACB8DBT3_DERSI|nr:hypothetical protein HPB49_010031 [Dermacentor silvarum]
MVNEFDADDRIALYDYASLYGAMCTPVPGWETVAETLDLPFLSASHSVRAPTAPQGEAPQPSAYREFTAARLRMGNENGYTTSFQIHYACCPRSGNSLWEGATVSIVTASVIIINLIKRAVTFSKTQIVQHCTRCNDVGCAVWFTVEDTVPLKAAEAALQKSNAALHYGPHGSVCSTCLQQCERKDGLGPESGAMVPGGSRCQLYERKNSIKSNAHG